MCEPSPRGGGSLFCNPALGGRTNRGDTAFLGLPNVFSTFVAETHEKENARKTGR